MANLQPRDVTPGNYTFVFNFENCNGGPSKKDVEKVFSLSDEGSYNVIAYWDKTNNNHQVEMVRIDKHYL